MEGKARPKSFRTSSSLGIKSRFGKLLAYPCVVSFDNGTLTSSAITNQLCSLGPPPHHQCVAVKDGKDIKRRFGTQTRLTGSCLDPCSEI